MNLYQQFVSAAEARDEQTLVRLIRQHPKLHPISWDEGCLLEVIRRLCPECFEAAFVAGLSPDSGPPPADCTLLQHAVCDNDLNLVSLCMRFGADLERRNQEGETVLGYAVAWASLAMVKLLVEAGADVNAVERSAEGFYSTALDGVGDNQPDGDRSAMRDYLIQRGARTLAELFPPAAL